MAHEEQYVVVVNDELEYATIPASWTVLDGWRPAGPTGTAEDCASQVDALWTDMRPLSLRRAMGDAPAPEGR